MGGRGNPPLQWRNTGLACRPAVIERDRPNFWRGTALPALRDPLRLGVAEPDGDVAVRHPVIPFGRSDFIAPNGYDDGQQAVQLHEVPSLEHRLIPSRGVRPVPSNP